MNDEPGGLGEKNSKCNDDLYRQGVQVSMPPRQEMVGVYFKTQSVGGLVVSLVPAATRARSCPRRRSAAPSP